MQRTSFRLLATAFALSAFVAFSASAQTEKRIDTGIEAVTVFLNKAQIERTAKTRIGAGRTTVVFQGLSPKIDPASLQVSGKGAATILNAKHAYNYLNKGKYVGEAKVYADSIETYQRQVQDIDDQIDILGKEETMLISNQAIGGENTGVNVEELKRMTVFFRERLTEIRGKRLDLAREKARVNTRIGELQRQLAEIRSERNEESGEIRVELEAQRAGEVTLSVKYLVNGASWTPTYDLRAEDVNSPIELAYKANVRQSTGVDWKQVKLTLSTNDPTLGGDKPELYTQYVKIYEPRPVVRKARQRYESAGFEEDEAAGFGAAPEPTASAPEMSTTANRTTSVETMLSAEFRIDSPYDIPSDGNDQLVDVQSNELEARYQHFAVPKMDEDAFLVAYIGDWEQYNLFSGDMNVYFSGTFVGTSYLDTDNLADTLEISLGRDQNVIIERKQLQDASSRKFIGANKRETQTFQIKVRNTKEQAIRIQIEDHIPVSEDNRVEVELLERKPEKVSRYDNEGFGSQDGKIVWEFILEPGAEKTLRFSYELTYPKGERVDYIRR